MLNVTLAYQTVEARLTLAVPPTLSPTETALPTPTQSTESGTNTPTTTNAPPTLILPTMTATSPVLCDQALPGSPLDVSIPDDSQIAAGQPFKKIWRLQNSGECTWTKKYGITWFSGEKFGAPVKVPLITSIAPEQIVDVSVDMIAPMAPGTYQSNWKLYNEANVLFGIGPSGGSPFWVRIVVVPSTPGTGTPFAYTPTPSTTPTQPAIVNGTAILGIGDQLDLDNLRVNSGVGEDLIYESTSKNKHRIAPIGNSLLGIFGEEEPAMYDCQISTISNKPVNLENLNIGIYLCFKTNQGFPGRMYVAGINPDSLHMVLEILTWYVP